jgi:hypothetical protein
MQYRKPTKKNKRKTVNLLEVMGLLCAVFIAISIALPYYIAKHKTISIDKNFYTNRTLNLKTCDYSKFWQHYDTVLKERGDADGNSIISVQEKADFDKAFFDPLNLTVDASTKDITEANGTHPNQNALICRIDSFYPDEPWVIPVCPNL